MATDDLAIEMATDVAELGIEGAVDSGEAAAVVVVRALTASSAGSRATLPGIAAVVVAAAAVVDSGVDSGEGAMVAIETAVVTGVVAAMVVTEAEMATDVAVMAVMRDVVQDQDPKLVRQAHGLHLFKFTTGRVACCVCVFVL